MEVIKHILKKSWLPITAVVLLIILLFQNCNNSEKQTDENKILQQKAKSNADFAQFYLDEFNKSNAKNYKLLEDIEKLKSKVLIKELNRKKNIIEKPKYLPLVKDCNDTIKVLYLKIKANDSICDDIINHKNIIINEQDTLIISTKNESFLLVESIKYKNNQVDHLQQIINNDKKILKKEKRKKTIWLIIASILGIGFLVK